MLPMAMVLHAAKSFRLGRALADLDEKHIVQQKMPASNEHDEVPGRARLGKYFQVVNSLSPMSSVLDLNPPQPL